MMRLYQLFGFFCVFLVFNYVYKECKGLKYRRALIPIVCVQIFFIMIGYKELSIPILTYLFIGGVGIPLVINGMMMDPNVLLIVAATYLPFNLLLPGTFGGFMKAFNLTNLILFALFVSLFLGKKQNSAKVFPASRTVIGLLAAYVVLTLMSYVRGSLFHGVHYLMALMFPVKRWLDPLVVFYLFYRMIKGRDIIKIIFAVLMLTVIVNVLYGVLQWVHLGLATYSDFRRRLTGISGHPNFYGAFIAYYLGFLLGPFLYNFKKITGKFLLLPSLLALRIIIPTNSRGAWLALAASLPALSIFRSKLTALFLIFAVGLMVVFPDYLIPSTIMMRVQAGTQPGVPEAAIYTIPGPGTILSESKAISIRTRWMLLEAGLEMAKENIWFGMGWGLFPYRIGDYAPNLRRASAHNMWLQMLCEMGLLTVLAVFAMLFFLLKSALYVLRQERDPMLKGMALGLAAAVPGVIVANLTGNRFDAEELMFPFWIVAACVLQLKNIIQTEKLKDERSVRL